MEKCCRTLRIFVTYVLQNMSTLWVNGMNEQIEVAGYNVTKTIRIDEEMEKRLQKIGLYEKAKPGTLMRMWIHGKIRTYYRNPDFKRWLKRLELIPAKR